MSMTTEINENLLLDMFKRAMVERLTQEGLDAIRPAIAKHAEQIVAQMESVVQKQMDARSHQLCIILQAKM